MKIEYAPTDLLFPDQFIDRTRHRADTFFGDGIVGHVSFADPICVATAGAMAGAARDAGARVPRGGDLLRDDVAGDRLRLLARERRGGERGAGARLPPRERRDGAEGAARLDPPRGSAHTRLRLRDGAEVRDDHRSRAHAGEAAGGAGAADRKVREIIRRWARSRAGIRSASRRRWRNNSASVPATRLSGRWPVMSSASGLRMQESPCRSKSA